ncbi:hypothetical protein [Pelagicoccus sp. SDUM812005]|uniref:ribonuclease HI n=1 Tax=Pelagicoccus sp. SDUM812005 TaxID=3041257 RepID=UPI00280FC927|nr:hypothetical protein [Pelagicoccus sp. SDUM812005]MDQ8182709.1 hypothetical protein [Pelagicoccus sp. SDUM812005]
MGTSLFIDGSCDPNSKIGYGALLRLDAGDSRSLVELKGEVRVRRFFPCGSSSLELMTFLWAIGELEEGAGRVSVFTDSQTMVSLLGRRADLEASGFCSRSGRALSQAVLYRDFYDVLDGREIELVKVAGHGPKAGKSREELLFALVDRASRRALRESARA